ncbi:unnamed protein product, partial [Ectocarpus sp. 8 AP-2014]
SGSFSGGTGSTSGRRPRSVSVSSSRSGGGGGTGSCGGGSGGMEVRARFSLAWRTDVRVDYCLEFKSEHQALAMPGRATVFIEVHAPAHFLVDLRETTEEAKTRKKNNQRTAHGGGSGGGGRFGSDGGGGAVRLKDFLKTLEQ